MRRLHLMVAAAMVVALALALACGTLTAAQGGDSDPDVIEMLDVAQLQQQHPGRTPRSWPTAEWPYFAWGMNRPHMLGRITPAAKSGYVPVTERFNFGGSRSGEGLAYGGILDTLQTLPLDDEVIMSMLSAVTGRLQFQLRTGYHHPNLTIHDWQPVYAAGSHLPLTENGKDHVKFSVEMYPGANVVPVVAVHPVMLGYTLFVQARSVISGLNDSVTVNMVHNISASYDLDGYWNIFQHTWLGDPLYVLTPSTLMGAAVAATEATIAPDAEVTASTMPSSAVRVMCYNVWNSNPPRWLIPDGYARWRRYVARVRYLADIVLKQQPDIIGLQEVRYDSTLGSMGSHAQMHHLATLIPGYQYVFQPASTYYNAELFPMRDEEGPAIMSKHPIVYTDYLMLSRDPTDAADEHQRVLLHAVIQLPSGVQVDVYTTHLSLSETARERSVQEIWAFMQSSRRGDVQILMGDLNAEPDSLAIQYLQGLAELSGRKTCLRDAWLEVHPEPEPRSPDADLRRNAFTFPSDDPVKRIDLVLTGRLGPECTAKPVKVHDVFLVGQDATSNTKHLENRGFGMVSPQSPLYSSDHRAVIALLEL